MLHSGPQVTARGWSWTRATVRVDSQITQGRGSGSGLSGGRRPSRIVAVTRRNTLLLIQAHSGVDSTLHSGRPLQSGGGGGGSSPRTSTRLDDRQNHLRDMARPRRLPKVCHCVIIARAATMSPSRDGDRPPRKRNRTFPLAVPDKCRWRSGYTNSIFLSE